MKKISIVLCLIVLSLCALPVFASAGSATVVWNANTEPDLDGYIVYWGTDAGGPYGSCTDLINLTTCYTITDLVPGSYYFVVTAMDTTGNESAYSQEVTKSILDTIPPNVTIASFPETTENSSFDLSGTASDDTAIAEVTWANSTTGETGTATGANTWIITDIALLLGVNQISITATDTSGQQGTEAITVTRIDTLPPVVAITSPTSADVYETNISNVTLSGSTSDNIDVSQVIWANANGGSGFASGTGSWSISNIPLVEGENVITVTAEDDSGNQGNSTLLVNYIPLAPTDTTPPTVMITSPTKKESYKTKKESLNISGIASDNMGLTQVTWTNEDTGGSGIASGLDSWSASGISLSNGENSIKITAMDLSGNMGYVILSVVCQAGARK